MSELNWSAVPAGAATCLRTTLLGLAGEPKAVLTLTSDPCFARRPGRPAAWTWAVVFSANGQTLHGDAPTPERAAAAAEDAARRGLRNAA